MILLEQTDLERVMLEADVPLWGAVPASALTGEFENLQEWLDSGRSADMTWMKNHGDIRRDPRLLMEDANTVIMIGVPYEPPQGSADPAQFRVSSYVTERDYHHVMKEILYRVLETLQIKYPELAGRVFCDTAPVMEKAWAVRAGIGWQGKNTNIINRRFGSWFFLAGIVINAAVDNEPKQVPDHCGTCSRCIDACPTGALNNPYRLDSNLCISYQTIENRKGSIPSEMDTAGWIYGCDICQQVCPWNISADTVSIRPEFRTLPEVQNRGEDYWTGLDEARYRKTVKKTAMKRQTFPNILRNIDHIRTRTE